MIQSWSITVEVPADDLVRRKGKLVRRTLGIPAVHNLRDWRLRSALAKGHRAKLDAALLASPGLRSRAELIQQQLKAGVRWDVLLIRRAPRPVDCAVQEGEWSAGGRGIGGDNLGSSLKAARDWTANVVLGLAGDSSPLVRWGVGQERSYKPRLYQIAILVMPATGRWYELPDRWLRGEL
jgi:hypothetical protein